MNDVINIEKQKYINKIRSQKIRKGAIKNKNLSTYIYIFDYI